MDVTAAPATIPARRLVQLDAALAVLLLLATLRTINRHSSAPIGVGWDVVRCTAAGAACGALLFRRRYPAVVLAIVVPATAILVALGDHGAGQAAIGFAVYSSAVRSPRRLRLELIAGIVGALAVAALLAPHGVSWAAVVAGPVVVTVGWLAGENVRAQREVTREAAERAVARERERDAQAREAATQERVQIARELHDVVAHSMSLIAVRAGAARLVLDTDRDEVRDALSIIETASRQALREMRQIVGVLREPGDSTGPLEPAPGLGDLPDLLDRVAHTGTHVDLHVDGRARVLPPGVDLSAYRIVQEAITNVVRHAGPTRAHVALQYHPDEIEIDVTDEGGNGPPGDASASGHGLIGMHERVALFGGFLTFGPAGRGFRVHARLPTDHDAAR